MSENAIKNQTENENDKSAREPSYVNLIGLSILGSVGIIAMFWYNPDNLAVVSIATIAFCIMLVGVFKLKRMTDN